jgi:hypothetical protein
MGAPVSLPRRSAAKEGVDRRVSTRKDSVGYATFSATDTLALPRCEPEYRPVGFSRF